jgi:hypothetical protein
MSNSDFALLEQRKGRVGPKQKMGCLLTVLLAHNQTSLKKFVCCLPLQLSDFAPVQLSGIWSAFLAHRYGCP